jgi:hypothetical protein
MPWSARLLLVAVGAAALAVARYRYRSAVASSAQARRFGAIPRALSGIWTYRVEAVLTGVVGLVFVSLGLLVK